MLVTGDTSKIIVSTDGGCRTRQSAMLNGENLGSIGVVMLYGDYKHEYYNTYRGTTNQRMEIQAVICALQMITNTNIPIEIMSDSAYVVNCINDKWYEKWYNNGWLNSKKEPVKNKDLWTEIVNQIHRLNGNVLMVKVKGHNGHELNERSDELVNIAMDLEEQKYN